MGDIVRLEPGTVQVRRMHWLASVDEDAKIALVDESHPAVPWKARESAHVVRVPEAPAGMVVSLRVSQSVVLWVTDDVVVHVGWSEREPFVIIAQEGCVITVSPRQVDAPVLRIASSLGAGLGTFAPPAITPEGRAIAAMDLGEIVVYRGSVPVVGERGVRSTACGHQTGRAARAYNAAWESVSVVVDDLWVYAKTREGREGALLVGRRPFQSTMWGVIAYAARDVTDAADPIIRPGRIDRWAPIVDVYADVPSRTLKGLREIVRADLLPALAPDAFQESDLYRAYRALREKLAAGNIPP